MFKKLKHDKGTAGLNVLLSVITLLFVIGLVVMIFSLMAGEIASSTTDPTAIQVINDTGSALAGVTVWFPIIIVITAMVVLILLTVIIITAIRGSGLVASA